MKYLFKKSILVSFRLKITAAFFLVILVPSVAEAVSNWQFFKLGLGRSASAVDANLPIQMHSLWSYTRLGAAGDLAFSSPVVSSNDYTYAASNSGWVYALPNTPPEIGNVESWKYQTGGPIYASPAYAQINGAEALFVASTDGNLYRLDPNAATEDLRLKWKTPLGSAVFSSPLVYSFGAVDQPLKLLILKQQTSELCQKQLIF